MVGRVSARSRVAICAVAALCAALVPGSASAADYSGTCTSPTARVADGYAGGSNYVLFRVQQNPGNPGSTWVCFRIGSTGGRLDVNGAGVNPGSPTVDETSTACTSTAGNTLPPPHPMLAGFVGPVTFMVDAYASSGSAMVCLEAGGTNRRVYVPVPGATTPSVTLFQDTGAPLPPADPGPVGYPSSGCQSGTFGDTTPDQYMNMQVGTAHAWLYTAQPTSTRAHVCARISGPVTFGGALTVDTTGTPGISPVIQQSTTDFTPCTVPLAGTTTPVVTYLAVSPSGANPASVCVQAGTTRQRITVGTTGSPSVTPPSWTQDPDSL